VKVIALQWHLPLHRQHQRMGEGGDDGLG
jgi:hypothetical protein